MQNNNNPTPQEYLEFLLLLIPTTRGKWQEIHGESERAKSSESFLAEWKAGADNTAQVKLLHLPKHCCSDHGQWNLK